MTLEARECDLCGSPMLWRCSDFSCPEIVNIDEGDVTPRSPVPGESAQAQFERDRAAFRDRARQVLAGLAALPVLFGGIAFLAVAWASGDVRVAGATDLLVAVGAIIWLARYLPNEVVWWGKGAEAERAVGSRLDSLEPLGFVTLTTGASSVVAATSTQSPLGRPASSSWRPSTAAGASRSSQAGWTSATGPRPMWCVR